jgi:hypothetical protein
VLTQAVGEDVAVIGEVGECYEVRGHHAGALVTWSWRYERVSTRLFTSTCQPFFFYFLCVFFQGIE